MKVNKGGCAAVATWIKEKLDSLGPQFAEWQNHELHPKTRDVSTLDWYVWTLECFRRLNKDELLNIYTLYFFNTSFQQVYPVHNVLTSNL